jgi:hypothetical protein
VVRERQAQAAAENISGIEIYGNQAAESERKKDEDSWYITEGNDMMRF